MQRHGSYRYAKGSTLLAVTERFSLTHRENDWLITTERITGTGASLTIEATADGPPALNMSAPLRVKRVSLRWSTDGGESSMSARFTLSASDRQGTIVEVVRTVSDGSETVATLPFSQKPVLSPLARITMGPTLLCLANSVGAQTVVPWFHDPSNHDLLFTAQVEDRVVEKKDKGSLHTPDGYLSGNTYQYVGGNYTAGDEFLVSDDGLLLAYYFGDLTIWRVDGGASD